VTLDQIAKCDGDVRMKSTQRLFARADDLIFGQSFNQIVLNRGQHLIFNYTDKYHPGWKTAKTTQFNGERRVTRGKLSQNLLETPDLIQRQSKRCSQRDVRR
jgi:hypothetical protein